MKQVANILFSVAGILWFFEGIPQIIKLIKRKSSDDISLFYFYMCVTAFILFLTGAILLKNWYLVFGHILPFININIIIFLVHKNRRKK